jgi:spore coat polysaccharide biosynthesis protein SpsF
MKGKPSMEQPGKHLSTWRGSFGDAYTDRNEATAEQIISVASAYEQILEHLPKPLPSSILEVGANIGVNLRALSRLTDARLFAVEPNAKARKRLIDDDVLPKDQIFNATAASLPFDDSSIDLVFTSGVLIHVPPEGIDTAYAEIHRVSARYILSLEYFSPTPEAKTYRGEDDLLFKRDYGALWLDNYPELSLIADGFFWKRTTGLDNLNWWLFQKP